MVLHAGQHESRGAIGADRVPIGPVPVEKQDGLQDPVAARGEHRRESIDVRGVHIGAGLEERGNGPVAIQRRVHEGGAAVVIRRVYIGSRRDQRLRARGLIARVRGLAEIQCGRPPVVPRVYVRPMLEQQPHARESPRAARRTRRRRPWRRRDGAGLSTARIPPDLVDQARIRVRAFAPPVHGPHWAEEASASRVGGLDVGSRSQR